MSSKKKQDYEVGYQKPPRATQFPKGKSGNPSGRPKTTAPEFDLGKVLQSIDNEEIIVKIDGKRKRMTKAELQFQQLFNKAIKGALTAARLIVSMAAEHSEPAHGGRYSLEVISQTEATKRFGRNWQRRVNEYNVRARGWKR